MRAFLLIVNVLVLMAVPVAQAQYPWPVQPVGQSQQITGTFCEYRDTGSAPHFHNGVDIPKPDGAPVYAVADGRVTSLDPSGANAFVRVGRFAYVHIAPNPALSVGDSVVAAETVLGTILPGQGHLHFVDGFVGSERQPLRKGGGLTPFEDPWAPEISNVRFTLQPTGQRLAPDALSGPVEITFRVAEQNGPPGAAASRRNNGAYVVGYKVLSADRTTEVFVPGAEGVRFRFDSKPSNAYVHNVFDPAQSSLSSHVYRATNALTRTESWDTAALPEGAYTVMLFAEDTRGNADTVYAEVQVTRDDLVPPPPATLQHVVEEAGTARLAWTEAAADDLAGYQLYRSTDALQWSLHRAPEELPGPVATFDDAAAPDTTTFYYLAAADASGNVSLQSDVYGVRPDGQGRQVLIVDGFDRTEASGSWQQEWHNFAVTHGQALAALGVGFSTCANDAVIDRTVDLHDYDAVFWLLGDESTADETFSSEEQAHVRSYLEGGGRLFISGSEVGWDLGARGSGADRVFLRDVLKASYAGDDAGTLRVEGTPGGHFDGLQFRYGTSPYAEDYPDYFTPTGGSEAVLTYDNGRIAGLAYAGPFGDGSEVGRLMLLGFPFETILGGTAQRAVLRGTLDFFFEAATTTTAPPPPPMFSLLPPYPNPSAGSPTLTFSLPRRTHVRLTVYDVLGRQVAVLADAAFGAGVHRLTPDVRHLPSGTYFVRFDSDLGPRTQRLIILR